MSRYYTLKGKETIPIDDVLEWAKEFEKGDSRRVNFHRIPDGENFIDVSTVFLGLDHQFGDGPPLLFETMVFGGELDDKQFRYTTWEEAEKGHLEVLERVKKTLEKP